MAILCHVSKVLHCLEARVFPNVQEELALVHAEPLAAWMFANRKNGKITGCSNDKSLWSLHCDKRLSHTTARKSHWTDPKSIASRVFHIPPTPWSQLSSNYHVPSWIHRQLMSIIMLHLEQMFLIAVAGWEAGSDITKQQENAVVATSGFSTESFVGGGPCGGICYCRGNRTISWCMAKHT